MADEMTNQDELSATDADETLAETDNTAAENAGDGGKRRANELDGKTWTRYSISIWSDIQKSADEVALGHPAIFPSALVRRLIEIFTNRSDRVVLDPFVGTGSTVLTAQQLGKKGIGIELSPKFAKLAKARCQQKTLFPEPDGSAGESLILEGDVRKLLPTIAAGSVDLVITSPPYWDVLMQKRSADYKDVRHYGEEEADLGKVHDYHAFLSELRDVFAQVFTTMRPGAYCCVVVMDLRKKDRFYPFHSDIADFMQEIGFLYDDIIIWDRRHEYNNMRPLGYPSVFRVNKAHEFILIFQKPRVTK